MAKVTKEQGKHEGNESSVTGPKVRLLMPKRKNWTSNTRVGI